MFVMKKCVISLLLVVSLLNLSTCQHHHHHHHDSKEDHAEPNPAFKYSKEANQETEQRTHSHHKTEPKSPTLDTQTLWLYAMGSTLIISAAPFFILFLVPLDSTDKDAPRFKYILAFASGGLLGDAFLHLIPHAAMSVAESSGHGHSHGHHHDHDDDNHNHDMSVGLWVLLGIVVFLIVEKTVRILKASTYFQTSSAAKADSGTKKNKKKAGKKDETNEDKESHQDIKVAGYLNLAADFSHNFTDGLAIGSSYLAGNTVGIVTTFTILCHEVPHEIGDFAILLQSGVKKQSAMMLQLGTAVGALCGTAFSLWFQNSDGAQATPWILPFTAGGFIYIALVSVIPELLDEEKPTFKQTFWQIFALAAGVGLMVLVAYFE